MNQITFKLDQDSDYISLCLDEGHKLFTIELKEWESEFYKRKFGALNVEDIDCLNKLRKRDVLTLLENILSAADRQDYNIIEIHTEISSMNWMSILEETGFRLVDSKITFITLIRQDDYELPPLSSWVIEYATQNDLKSIIELTNRSYIRNPDFFSRFKNELYFSKNEIEKYYLTWVTNSIEDKDSYFIVMKDHGKIFAFFIYRRSGFHNEKPLYKGILTVVDTEFRGKNTYTPMQTFLYKQFPDKEFFLDNTTQLTNIPTIINHIKSAKRLDRIGLIFFRTRNGDFSSLLK
jgi:hypothetical protein